MWHGGTTYYLLHYEVSMGKLFRLRRRFGFTAPEIEAQIIRLDKRTDLEQMCRLRNNGVKTESYKAIST